MAHIADNSHQNQLLLLALLCSIALHGTAVVFLPDYFAHAPTPDTQLTVELLKPEPPPPPPPPVKKPEPPKPEPVKPKVIPPSKPLPAPAPKPVTPQPQAVVQPATPPPVTAPPPVAEPPQVIAVPQKAAEPPPPVVVPTPSAPPPQETAAEDISAIKNGYGRLLAGEFAKHKKYPQVARMRGWQGTVQVRLQVDADGNPANPVVEQSSGREILDNQALETVRNSLPLPTPPAALRGKAFSIVVPVVFRLD